MNPFTSTVSLNASRTLLDPSSHLLQRYPLMQRSVSSPTPTSQMGGGGTMENSTSVPGNMSSRDQMSNMLSTPSTPPPHSTVPNSMGVAGGGSNAAYTNSSSLTTSIASSSNNRNTTAANATNASTLTSTSTTPSSLNREQVYSWIQELSSPETREHALIELSRKREVLPDLAPMLWHSFGTIAALLQEIVMIYPVINPPTLNVS